MVCVGLSERDLKNFGGTTWRARQNFGGQWPPWNPLVPTLNLKAFAYDHSHAYHSLGTTAVLHVALGMWTPAPILTFQSN